MSARRVAALVLLLLCCSSIVAVARPGGGESYASDSGGSSSWSYDGSDSDDSSDGVDGEALAALVDLIIRYPKVGIPVLLAVLGFMAVSARTGGDSDWDSISRSLHAASDDPPTPRARPSLAPVRGVDPDFSQVFFEDFVFRLYAAAHTARGVDGALDTLAPYVSAAARRALAERDPKGAPVSGVVIGQLLVQRVSVPDSAAGSGDFDAYVKIGVQFEANYSVGPGAGGRRFVVEEWLLRRAAGARTKPPAPDRRFPCPNCGAPWRTEQAAGGQTCAFCGAVVDNGRFDWQVERITLRRETANIPGLESEVPEQGTSRDTVRDPAFADAWRRFMDDDPEVTESLVAARLAHIYTTLNGTWSRGDVNGARPVLSDGLADYLQYWLDAYQARGLRNGLDDMRLTRHELVALTRDRYYDALTIRIWATGKDYVIRTDGGTLVRGSRDRDRDYSEYWTLIRSAARRGAPRADATCGSCGAAHTVTMAGRCEHCGSHVTAGEFDWVLSKIEQDDAYST